MATVEQLEVQVTIGLTDDPADELRKIAEDIESVADRYTGMGDVPDSIESAEERIVTGEDRDPWRDSSAVSCEYLVGFDRSGNSKTISLRRDV